MKFAALIFLFGVIATTLAVECPKYEKDDKVEYLLPHKDCAKFIKCTPDGTPVEVECPKDTQFNPVLKVCDWTANAGCKGGA